MLACDTRGNRLRLPVRRHRSLPVERDPADRCTLLNPTVIVEVLSETTEAYDRGDKFAHYWRLPSLREYVLVSSGMAGAIFSRV